MYVLWSLGVSDDAAPFFYALYMSEARVLLDADPRVTSSRPPPKQQ